MSDEENLDEVAEEKPESEGSQDQEALDDPQEALDDPDDEGFEDVEWIGEKDWDDIDEDEEEVQLPTYQEFVDNGDGTISDPRNSIMWAKADSFKEFGYGINWYEANDYIETLNEKKLAGYDDWRLCSREESKAIFSFVKSNTDHQGAEIHIDPLFETGGGYNTWTYEEKPDYHQYAEKFNYITGNEHWENKDNEYSHVRAVRDEKADTWEPEWRKKTKKFDS